MDRTVPYTLIIADDDPEDLELLKALFLYNENFAVVGCLGSSVQVLDEISRKKNIPDILLIDMYMPFHTGIEVVNALETLEVAKATIKFVISSTVNLPEKEKHQNNPNIIFMKKPVTIEEMKELPEIVLEVMLQSNTVRV